MIDGNNEELLPYIVSSGRFKQGAAAASALPFKELMRAAAADWALVNHSLRQPSIEALPMGPLAGAVELSWPSTRFNEPLGRYLKFQNPQQLLSQRGIGKNRVRTLVVVVCGINELITDKCIDGSPLGEIEIPSDPCARVALFWPRIQSSITSSEMADKELMDLARGWGIKWPTRTNSNYSLRNVLAADSLSQFVAGAASIGKKKMPSIAEVVWKAWTIVEPDGPAGPPKSGNDVAIEEFESIPEDTDAATLVQRGLDLAGLTDREQSVIERRYGLEGTNPMTLEEVGKADRVTRERIRQVQVLAENKIRDNLASREFLRLTLEHTLPQILRSLEDESQSPLLPTDGDWHRCLAPPHSFLIEVLHGNIRQLLDQLVEDRRIEKTSAGWWLGSTLATESDELAERIQDVLNTEKRPLPVPLLAETEGVSLDHICSSALSVGLLVEMGYVFRGRLSAGHRRCLFALEVAIAARRWLWPDLEFYQTAFARNKHRAGSLRLLLRDTENIPGVAIDIPGPFVIINPFAANNAGTQGFPLENPSDEKEEEDPVQPAHDPANSDTLAGQLEALMGNYRILKFDNLENLFCEAEISSSPGSLGPTLLSRPQFIRYAPAYWGLSGLELKDEDVETLCNDKDLRRYAQSKQLGGLDELFPFWCPEMEYRWCRWAEREAEEALFHSLLALCEPNSWSVARAIQVQWEGKRDRLGINRMPAIHGSLDMAYVEFTEIYGLVHLASQRGSIGPATIPHYYGLREADRKALGTMALLGVLGILNPRADLNSPWTKGPRVDEWLDLMSALHYRDPRNAESRWREILKSAVESLNPSEDFGWFCGEELQESFVRWTA